MCYNECNHKNRKKDKTMTMVYCRECGKKYSSRATKCPKCGYVQYNWSKSIAVYLLLCWFLGVFGVHRFYVGKIVSGIVMFILSMTMVGLFITIPWSLIDFIIGICNISTPEKIFNNEDK